MKSDGVKSNHKNMIKNNEEIKILNFVGKEKFLKSDGIESNHKNMMVEFYLIMKVRMKGRVFSGDSLNKNIPRKKSSVA